MRISSTPISMTRAITNKYKAASEANNLRHRKEVAMFAAVGFAIPGCLNQGEVILL
jgi:hypothetical protein